MLILGSWVTQTAMVVHSDQARGAADGGTMWPSADLQGSHSKQALENSHPNLFLNES